MEGLIYLNCDCDSVTGIEAVEDLWLLFINYLQSDHFSFSCFSCFFLPLRDP